MKLKLLFTAVLIVSTLVLCLVAQVPLLPARGYHVPVPGVPTLPISGAKMQLDAYQITGLSDGDPVATWSDVSGNSNDATQSNSAKRPLYKTSIVNGLPVVRFDTTDDGMVTPLTISAIPLTIFLVYSAKSGAFGRRALCSTTLNWLIGPRVDVGNKHAFFDGAAWMNAPLSYVEDDFVYITLKIVTGSTSFRVDGIEVGSAGSAFAAPATICLGASNPYGEPLWGDIAEVIVYDTGLSAGDISAVESYIVAKYGL